MVRYAVGYRSRAIVSFGPALATDGVDPNSRRAVLDYCHAVMTAIGRVYKVLPTAVVAHAMRPSIALADLEARADAVLDTLRAAGANLGVHSGAEALELGLEPLEARGVLVLDAGRVRVRERNVLRYYGRGLDHLVQSPSSHTH
jgi:hypothetical protein